MTQGSYVYRIFPPEVVSNSFDFEIRPVIHNGTRMRGVFARRPIMARECSLFMGVYPGFRVKKEDSLRKISRFSQKHNVEINIAARKMAAYTLSLKEKEPGYVLDPTDEEGLLAEEFIPYLAGYINEPPPQQPVKSAYVYNQPRARYEAWLVQPVAKDEEIFVSYGRHYLRDYPINPDSFSQQPAHYIPLGSEFIPDPRGSPEPIQVPEVAHL